MLQMQQRFHHGDSKKQAIITSLVLAILPATATFTMLILAPQLTQLPFIGWMWGGESGHILQGLMMAGGLGLGSFLIRFKGILYKHLALGALGVCIGAAIATLLLFGTLWECIIPTIGFVLLIIAGVGYHTQWQMSVPKKNVLQIAAVIASVAIALFLLIKSIIYGFSFDPIDFTISLILIALIALMIVRFFAHVHKLKLSGMTEEDVSEEMFYLIRLWFFMCLL